MALQTVRIVPGINKSDTPSGAEGQWIDADFIRFRYGQPEKIGGWQATGLKTFSGPARAIHTWSALDGRNYMAIGTSKLLLIYYEGQYYDATPLGTAITGATFTSTNGSATVTVNATGHGLAVGDYFTFSSVTVPGATTTLNGAITDSDTTITLTDASSFSTSGSVRIEDEIITYTGKSSNDLTGCTRGTNGTTAAAHADGTAVRESTVTRYNTSDFTTNTFEVITVPSANTFTITMPSTETGTGMTAAGGATINPYVTVGPTIQTYGFGWGTGVWDDSDFGWGDDTSDTEQGIVLEPGSWSLDNFGQILTATIKDGETFTWNPGVSNPLDNRATIMTNAPTKSRLSIVSDRDRHFIHMGTETTIGDPTTQDPMFIRFSNQEDFNTYQPTATNTAGTFRLDAGNKIVTAIAGKDYVLILTDTAAFVMQFVGPPFTFSIRQVGTNCGCLGQHAAVYANGNVYWMGLSGGFFVYDGTVKILPSLIEDFVYTTTGDNLGLNFQSNETVFGSHNSLFNEIVWFYPKGTPTTTPSTQNDRMISYNYVENTWSISSLSRSAYVDSDVYANPYATSYNPEGTPQFPTINGVTDTFGAGTLFIHETGVNEILLDGSTNPIEAFVKSGDFDLPIGPEGTGEFFVKVRRFLPDFKNLQGTAKVTLNTKDYPIAGNTTTSVFDVNNSTDKIDTRVRGRLANIKIENTLIDENWRYGTFRVDVQPDGRR